MKAIFVEKNGSRQWTPYSEIPFLFSIGDEFKIIVCGDPRYNLVNFVGEIVGRKFKETVPGEFVVTYVVRVDSDNFTCKDYDWE